MLSPSPFAKSLIFCRILTSVCPQGGVNLLDVQTLFDVESTSNISENVYFVIIYIQQSNLVLRARDLQLQLNRCNLNTCPPLSPFRSQNYKHTPLCAVSCVCVRRLTDEYPQTMKGERCSLTSIWVVIVVREEGILRGNNSSPLFLLALVEGYSNSPRPGRR